MFASGAPFIKFNGIVSYLVHSLWFARLHLKNALAFWEHKRTGDESHPVRFSSELNALLPFHPL